MGSPKHAPFRFNIKNAKNCTNKIFNISNTRNFQKYNQALDPRIIIKIEGASQLNNVHCSAILGIKHQNREAFQVVKNECPIEIFMQKNVKFPSEKQLYPDMKNVLSLNNHASCVLIYRIRENSNVFYFKTNGFIFTRDLIKNVDSSFLKSKNLDYSYIDIRKVEEAFNLSHPVNFEINLNSNSDINDNNNNNNNNNSINSNHNNYNNFMICTDQSNVDNTYGNGNGDENYTDYIPDIFNVNKPIFFQYDDLNDNFEVIDKIPIEDPNSNQNIDLNLNLNLNNDNNQDNSINPQEQNSKKMKIETTFDIKSNEEFKKLEAVEVDFSRFTEKHINEINELKNDYEKKIKEKEKEFEHVKKENEKLYESEKKIRNILEKFVSKKNSSYSSFSLKDPEGNMHLLLEKWLNSLANHEVNNTKDTLDFLYYEMKKILSEYLNP